MKNISFKADPEYSFRFQDVHVPQLDGSTVVDKRLLPTRHFSENLAKTIYPKRGLTRAEMRDLPAGITVVQSKGYNLDKKERSIGGIRLVEDPESKSRNLDLHYDDQYGKIDYYPVAGYITTGSIKIDELNHNISLFSINDLVSFGNYLLSEQREESAIDIHQRTVTDADIENWKLLSSKTISTEESSDLNGSMP